MSRLILIYWIISLTVSMDVSVYADEVWKGLEFERSTVDEAIKTVGKPRKKRTEEMKELSERSGKVVGKRDLLVIEYEKIDGWNKVALSFLDEKLFRAKFWPRNKSLTAFSLSSTYQADFVSVNGFAKGVSLSVFEGQKEPAVPRVYQTVYYMVSAKSDRYIVAHINNSSFKAFLKQIGNEPTVQMFPGFVDYVEIISRGFEGKKLNADIRITR